MKRYSFPRTVDLPRHGLFALESPHSEHFQMEERAWPFHKLCWIAAGKGTVDSGTLSNPVAMGDILWIPKDTPHRFVDRAGDPMTLILVCVQPHVFESAPGGQDLLDHFLSLQRTLQVFRLPKYAQEQIRNDLRTLLVEQHLRKSGWAASSLSVFFHLMVTLTRVIPQRNKENPRDLFLLTVAHIEDHFFQNVRTSDLADMCHVSERTYSGLFKKRMGMTVTAYLRKCRIAYARERLLETGNIAYAAYESGFSDLAHFYRVFKAEEGVPPGKFLEEQTS